MPTFQYRALQTNGAIAEGVIEAGGRQEAFRLMEGQGLRPVSLAEKANGKARKVEARPKPQAQEKAPEKTETAPKKPMFSFGAKKITPRALENFTRLLSSLLAAGVPLSRALVILTKEASSPAAAAKWKEIHDLVIDGMSLADAMSKSPETFPRV
jgi:general secretion pathway protein F